MISDGGFEGAELAKVEPACTGVLDATTAPVVAAGAEDGATEPKAAGPNIEPLLVAVPGLPALEAPLVPTAPKIDPMAAPLVPGASAAAEAGCNAAPWAPAEADVPPPPAPRKKPAPGLGAAAAEPVPVPVPVPVLEAAPAKEKPVKPPSTSGALLLAVCKAAAPGPVAAAPVPAPEKALAKGPGNPEGGEDVAGVEADPTDGPLAWLLAAPEAAPPKEKAPAGIPVEPGACVASAEVPPLAVAAVPVGAAGAPNAEGAEAPPPKRGDLAALPLNAGAGELAVAGGKPPPPIPPKMLNRALLDGAWLGVGGFSPLLPALPAVCWVCVLPNAGNRLIPAGAEAAGAEEGSGAGKWKAAAAAPADAAGGVLACPKLKPVAGAPKRPGE